MPDEKISQLAEKLTVGDNDLVPIVDNDSDPANKLIKVANLKTQLKGNQGDVGTQYPFRGGWLTTTAYLQNDCVQKNGNGYVCMVSHTSGVFDTDLDAGKWALLVQKGDGTAYPWQGAWVTNTSYQLNDCIQKDGSAYVCMIAHNSSVFATDLSNGDWSLLVAKGDTGSQGLQGITGSNVNLAWGTSDTPPGGAADGTLYVVYAP